MSAKKRPTQRKQGHKDKKCERGKPLYYEELKERLGLSLTPTAKQSLEEMAAQEKCSISELLERWVRGKLHTKPEAIMEGKTDSLRNTSAILPAIEILQADFTKRIDALEKQVTELVQALRQQLVPPNSNQDSSFSRAITPDLQTFTSSFNTNQILTTHQAWELAQSRGYTKSKDAFRNWSRRSPQQCSKLYGLECVEDSNREKVVGYRDMH